MVCRAGAAGHHSSHSDQSMPDFGVFGEGVVAIVACCCYLNSCHLPRGDQSALPGWRCSAVAAATRTTLGAHPADNRAQQSRRHCRGSQGDNLRHWHQRHTVYARHGSGESVKLTPLTKCNAPREWASGEFKNILPPETSQIVPEAVAVSPAADGPTLYRAATSRITADK